MRNNTKLKKLLQNNVLQLSADKDKIDMIVTSNVENTSFIVTESSITKLLDTAIKLAEK